MAVEWVALIVADEASKACFESFGRQDLDYDFPSGFRHNNLFIVDASIFPTSVSVDPPFTIMAFAALIAKSIDERRR